MFVREKVARGHRYFYLVESVREGGRVRQRTIRALGRKDVLHASGELDRLIASLARHSERAMVLSDMEVGRLACIRIGGPLLFGRLCVVKRVSSPPIGALTDCFSAIRGGQLVRLTTRGLPGAGGAVAQAGAWRSGGGGAGGGVLIGARVRCRSAR